MCVGPVMEKNKKKQKAICDAAAALGQTSPGESGNHITWSVLTSAFRPALACEDCDLSILPSYTNIYL
jgi:hypothetical protein